MSDLKGKESGRTITILLLGKHDGDEVPSTFPRIPLHRGIVDFRKCRRSLAALVESEIRESPFTATLFLFMSRRRDRIRALYWDRTGFAL